MATITGLAVITGQHWWKGCLCFVKFRHSSGVLFAYVDKVGTFAIAEKCLSRVSVEDVKAGKVSYISAAQRKEQRDTYIKDGILPEDRVYGRREIDMPTTIDGSSMCGPRGQNNVNWSQWFATWNTSLYR